MSEIGAKDIIQWQNEMMRLRGKSGKPFSATYLKTLHNQVSAIFNHAVRFYDLKANPAAKAGSVGKKEAKEMLFWTKDEYLKFADAMMDKPLSFYAFEMLYWCGIRLGELLALTPSDFDFEKGTVSITKSYQRIDRQDVITEPKTPKSNRTIKMPDFLCQEMREHRDSFYDCPPGDRLFPISKSYLHHEMDWGSKAVAFRMSPEEDAQLEIAVRLSGLTKQDYIIRRLQCRDVVVQGNPRVYKALRNELANVLDELRRLGTGEAVGRDLTETIRLIAITLDGLKEG